MKTVCAIRHVAFEDLATFEPLLIEKGYRVTYVEAANGGWDTIDDPDLLIVLGGPIGAYEESLYPFLLLELQLIEQRLRQDRPILGICLGSQLMARALGARVYPGSGKEIGWSPLTLTEAGATTALRHLGDPHTSVLHWHGDTFDLPEGAVRLASTAAYINQAFAWGRSALALQFHPEVSAAGLEHWFIGHACEIAATDGVSVGQLRADAARHAQMLQQQGRAFLAEWLDRLDR